ncbi:MAG: GTPase HflX [Candidatus Cloacimonadota bacterium]|nr:MAG: GTPase HflX [Candidatus Cloacimonadota bacterium]
MSNFVTREWQKFKDYQLGEDLSNLELFLEAARLTHKRVDQDGYFLVRRNGWIFETGPDPVEFCDRIVHQAHVEGFCHYSLWVISSEQNPSLTGKEAKLLKNFKLDSLLKFSTLLGKENLVSYLSIKDGILLTDTVITEKKDNQFLKDSYQSKVFLKRDQQLDFHKKNYLIEEEKSHSLLVQLEFTKRGLKLAQSSQDEIEALAKTLSLNISEVISQKAAHPIPGTFMGTGKYNELLLQLEGEDYSHVLLNCNVPNSFKTRLENKASVKVWDRTDIILSIFEKHAQTDRAKLQVELARLRCYGEAQIIERLKKRNTGAESGMDGSLDSARYYLNQRKKEIKNQLEKINRQDETKRKTRNENRPPSIALIGYTNVGKSTLFNQFLSRYEVEVENVYFKTLDTTTRTLEISKHSTILISDTVGFIKKLPSDLQLAFFTTLAESKNCNQLLILLDPSGGLDVEEQITCMKDALHQIERYDEENWYFAINKEDLLDSEEKKRLQDELGIDIFFSAKSPESVEKLKNFIVEKIGSSMIEKNIKLSYADYGKIHELKNFTTLPEDPIYKDDYITIKLQYSNENLYKIENCLGLKLDDILV